MPLKSIVRDVRDGIGSFSRRSSFEWRRDRSAPASASSVSFDFDPEDFSGEQSCWASLPPELLRDVMKRVDASESVWPARKHVVACAAVCQSWRHMCKEIVGTPEISAQLTFPVSLKQSGPRTGPIQCYIKRNKATSTYHLYLGLNPETGKFLLAARKVRRPTHAEYIISLDAEDISRNSVSYIGKLRTPHDTLVNDLDSPLGGSCRGWTTLHSPRVLEDPTLQLDVVAINADSCRLLLFSYLYYTI